MESAAYPDQSHRIAIIDDDYLFTRVVEATLRDKAGHQVLVVNDPEKAILALKGFRPHIILLDIIMPKLDGARLHFMLEQDEELRGIPVIVLSGLVAKTQAPDATSPKSPADTRLRLSKPLNPEALIHAVELELGRRGGRVATAAAGHAYPLREGADVIPSRGIRPGDPADPEGLL